MAEDVLAREAAERQRIIKDVYLDPRSGFGSIASTLKAAKERNPFVKRSEVKDFFETLRERQDRPQRGYNSFVPLIRNINHKRTQQALHSLSSFLNVAVPGVVAQQQAFSPHHKRSCPASKVCPARFPAGEVLTKPPVKARRLLCKDFRGPPNPG